MISFKEFVRRSDYNDRLKHIERFKIDPETWNYPKENLARDVNKIMEIYNDKFLPNQKLLETLKDPVVRQQEEERLKYIILEAFKNSPWKTAAGKIWNITKWVANNGKDPAHGFVGNADQRWTNIFKKLGYL